ncbi:MAG: vitamin K epoxide reductase family protein [Gemmatimonadaceae bacterium]
MSSNVHRSAPAGGLLGLSWRQLIALIAVVNAFVATYLHLWKIGKAGTLACGGSGGCAIVQFSPWSWFLGVDVALIGAVGYSVLVLVAVIGATARFADARWPVVALAALVYPAVAFTVRLKWAEFYKLRTFCPWCAISAVSITLLAVIVWLEWRRQRAVSPAALANDHPTLTP